MTASNLDLASELWAMSQGSNPIDVATSAIAAQLDAFAERIRADEREEIAVMADGCSDGWLDAEILVDFAEAIRARSSTAPVQPVALPAVTVEHDSTPLPAGMPEPVAAQIREGFGDWVEHPLASALAGGFWAGFQVRFLYTAAQVQAMLAQGLAPGWQAVPVEPTPKMVDSTFRDDLSGLSHNARNKFIYRDMLAAAPKPPAAQSSPTAVERKPLTHEQVLALIEAEGNAPEHRTMYDFARAIERAHGIDGIKAHQGGAA